MPKRRSLYRDTRGGALVEYALLLLAICVLGVAGWRLLGRNVSAQVDCATENFNGQCGGGKGSGQSVAAAAGGGGAAGGGAGGGGAGGGANDPAGALPASPAMALMAFASPAGGGSPSFSEQVRGTDPKPIDGTFAQIAGDVPRDGTGGNIGGFTRLDAAQLEAAGINPSALNDPSTGFRAAIYRDANGNTVLAYAGSQDLKDWKTNFTQGLGFSDAQYNQAVSLAKEAKAAFGDSLVITGHSLGGGLASAGALATGSPAVTFNSSGLNDKTIQRLDLDPNAARAQAENGQVRRYAVDGEILTNLQENNVATRGLMPDAVGRKITLPDPKPLTGFQKWIPGARTKHGADLHGMGPVHDSMRKWPPWGSG
ncbi:hypothetical protein [Pendulispora albinea]|uniref:DUF2974 domain-containing protein n=1 Tax=Pendulispora albinea TaxID=2741071 RepID=A0ABZ2LN11_9BACT